MFFSYTTIIIKCYCERFFLHSALYVSATTTYDYYTNGNIYNHFFFCRLRTVAVAVLRHLFSVIFAVQMLRELHGRIQRHVAQFTIKITRGRPKHRQVFRVVAALLIHHARQNVIFWRNYT